MRIWLVQIGEELPFDPGPPRLLRTALLAAELVKRGHDVTFWNASFNHQQKTLRSPQTRMFPTDAGYRVILLHGRAYRKNISLARIRSQRENAASFRKAVRSEAPPDVMLCGMPPIELADAASAYAVRHGVPVAVDCRDLWPDVISEQLSPIRRPFAWPLLSRWRQQLRRTLRRATSITGVSEGFVQWALTKASRERSRLDRAFHLTLSADAPDAADVRRAEAYWNELLGPSDGGPVVGIFAGTLSRRLDLQTLVSATAALPADARQRLRIVICGKGDLESEIRMAAEQEPALEFVGWKSAAELRALMMRAHFGILPYPSTPDFLLSFPNKVGEYLSFGLPIMTGLQGMIGTLLDERHLALRYDTGNAESARDLLASIARNQVEMTSLRDGALEAFRSLFDPRKIYPAFADHLEHLATLKGAVA